MSGLFNFRQDREDTRFTSGLSPWERINMNKEVAEVDKQVARQIRFPFPCGCQDEHTVNGFTAPQHTCDAHQAIAAALTEARQQQREVSARIAESIFTPDKGTWNALYVNAGIRIAAAIRAEGEAE